ncbi:hypothetical protein STEG23_015776, partial [Scotinomys teguina]
MALRSLVVSTLWLALFHSPLAHPTVATLVPMLVFNSQIPSCYMIFTVLPKDIHITLLIHSCHGTISKENKIAYYKFLQSVLALAYSLSTGRISPSIDSLCLSVLLILSLALLLTIQVFTRLWPESKRRREEKGVSPLESRLRNLVFPEYPDHEQFSVVSLLGVTILNLCRHSVIIFM